MLPSLANLHSKTQDIVRSSTVKVKKYTSRTVEPGAGSTRDNHDVECPEIAKDEVVRVKQRNGIPDVLEDAGRKEFAVTLHFPLACHLSVDALHHDHEQVPTYIPGSMRKAGALRATGAVLVIPHSELDDDLDATHRYIKIASIIVRELWAGVLRVGAILMAILGPRIVPESYSKSPHSDHSY